MTFYMNLMKADNFSRNIVQMYDINQIIFYHKRGSYSRNTLRILIYTGTLDNGNEGHKAHAWRRRPCAARDAVARGGRHGVHVAHRHGARLRLRALRRAIPLDGLMRVLEFGAGERRARELQQIIFIG